MVGEKKSLGKFSWIFILVFAVLFIVIVFSQNVKADCYLQTGYGTTPDGFRDTSKIINACWNQNNILSGFPNPYNSASLLKLTDCDCDSSGNNQEGFHFTSDHYDLLFNPFLFWHTGVQTEPPLANFELSVGHVLAKDIEEIDFGRVDYFVNPVGVYLGEVYSYGNSPENVLKGNLVNSCSDLKDPGSCAGSWMRSGGMYFGKPKILTTENDRYSVQSIDGFGLCSWVAWEGGGGCSLTNARGEYSTSTNYYRAPPFPKNLLFTINTITSGSPEKVLKSTPVSLQVLPMHPALKYNYLSIGGSSNLPYFTINNQAYLHPSKGDALKCSSSSMINSGIPGYGILDSSSPNVDVFVIYKLQRSGNKYVEVPILNVQANDQSQYIFKDQELETIYDSLSGEQDRKIVCKAMKDGQVIGSTAPVVLMERNIKNPEKYGPKEDKWVFVAPDEDWRTVFQAVPATIWQKTGEYDESWCNQPNINISKCGYPLLLYHKEGSKILPSNPGVIFDDKLPQNVPKKSFIDFINLYYKPKRTVVIDSSEQTALMGNINSLVQPLNKDWWKEQWEEAGIVVVADYGGDGKNYARYSLAYKNAIQASRIASYYNSPLVFVGDENREDWENYMHDKIIILVGNLTCSDCLKELKKKNLILSKTLGPVEEIYFDQAVYEGFEGQPDYTIPDYNIADHFIKKIVRDIRYADYNPKIGKTAIIVNPDDIYSKVDLQEFAEEFMTPVYTFTDTFKGLSMTAPYLASATDSVLGFINTGGNSFAGRIALLKKQVALLEEEEKQITSGDYDSEAIDSIINEIDDIYAARLTAIEDMKSSIQNDIITDIDGNPVLSIKIDGEDSAIPPCNDGQFIILDGKLVFDDGYNCWRDINNDGKINLIDPNTDIGVGPIGKGISSGEASVRIADLIFND